MSPMKATSFSRNRTSIPSRLLSKSGPFCPVLIKYVTHVVCATVKHDSYGGRFRVWFEHLVVRNVMDRTFVIVKFLFGDVYRATPRGTIS